MNEKNAHLFKSLALASLPIERTFHLALEIVSSDEEISKEYRDELIKEIKSLLFNSLSLHGYLSIKNPGLDYRKDGESKYFAIREKVKSLFPSEYDKEFSLHHIIEEDVDNKVTDKAKK